MSAHSAPHMPSHPLRRLWRDFRRSPVAIAALLFLLAATAAAIGAGAIAPQDPFDLAQLDIMDGLLPPGSEAIAGGNYLLGSDDQGRDIFSAILYGLRTSLVVAVTSAFFAAIIGTSLGLLGAYHGGWVDALIMRAVDLQLAFPAILVALMILAFLGNGIFNVVLALIIVEWATYARAARSSALVEIRRDYAEAASALGVSTAAVIFRHILPNCLPPLTVILTVQLARAISLEATLSFLGLGVPVTEPSLGMLISNGFRYMMSGQYWVSFFPGIALLVVIIAINLVGDHLREITNPRGAR